MLVVELIAHDERGVVVTAACHADVERFGGGGLVGDQHGAIDRYALGLVHSERVRERDVLVDVVGGQYDATVSGEMGHGDRAVTMAGGDRPAVAVADPRTGAGHQAAVIPGRDDLVAHTDGLAVGGGDPGWLDLTGRDSGGADAPSDAGDGGVVGGADDHGRADTAGVVPGGEGGVEGAEPIAARDSPVSVVLDDDRRVAGAEAQAGVSLPCSGEAPHTRELDRVDVGEEAEEPAGLDGAELGVVPDQDELGLGPVGELGEAGQVAAGDHAGLVDHHDLPTAESPAVVGRAGTIVFEQQLGDGVRSHAGLRLQHTGGNRRHRQAAYGHAGRLPRVGRSAHGA